MKLIIEYKEDVEIEVLEGIKDNLIRGIDVNMGQKSKTMIKDVIIEND